MDEIKKMGKLPKEETLKVTKPAVSPGSRLDKKPGKTNPVASTHCDLPHFDLPNGGDGTHFDVAHSDTTFNRKANVEVSISGRLGKSEILKLAEMGLTIENCKISLPAEKAEEFQKLITQKKG